MAMANDTAAGLVTEYVTVTIGDHMFGLPIFRVRDVFVPDRLTRVPLAPPEVAGVLNLRGRVVTAIDMRARLDLGARPAGTPLMAIGIELKGESYGLLVDAVGEVMALRNSACEAKPSNLDPRLSRVAAGIYRLEGQLMVVLDVDRVLDIRNGAVAA
ncbi:MAG: purine-binding chemotaxis protein CheW [Alphaproteobacteria bacterium]|jgi:purine-binding chemotaxis protein CheW|nr:purine-binding chemotaxis protein CheW [Alphaproteobacteria bacterium]